MSAPIDGRVHIEALLTMLAGHLPGLPTSWSVAPAGAAPPYAVLYPDVGSPSGFDQPLCDRQARWDLRYQVTAVGSGPQQAAWVADRVRAVLLTETPSVAGRRLRVAVQEAAQLVARDDDAGGYYYATAQYLTVSDPA